MGREQDHAEKDRNESQNNHRLYSCSRINGNRTDSVRASVRIVSASTTRSGSPAARSVVSPGSDARSYSSSGASARSRNAFQSPNRTACAPWNSQYSHGAGACSARLSAEVGRKEVPSVSTGRTHAHELRERSHVVREPRHVIRNFRPAGARPGHHAISGTRIPAFPELRLSAPQAAGAVEELVVHSSDPRRPVVTREQNDSPLVEAEFDQQVEDASDLAIHPGDHRRVGRERLRLRQVASVSRVRCLRKLAPILGHGRIRDLQGEVRNRKRNVEEERLRPGDPG